MNVAANSRTVRLLTIFKLRKLSGASVKSKKIISVGCRLCSSFTYEFTRKIAILWINRKSFGHDKMGPVPDERNTKKNEINRRFLITRPKRL